MTDEELQIQALDAIAAMVYQTKLNVECLVGKLSKLQQTTLKDVVILFTENQRSWLAKMERGLKKIGINEVMQKDLSSTDLAYYSIICEFARQGKDMAGLSDLMEAAKDVESLEAVLQQIKAILFNAKQMVK